MRCNAGQLYVPISLLATKETIKNQAAVVFRVMARRILFNLEGLIPLGGQAPEGHMPGMGRARSKSGWGNKC